MKRFFNVALFALVFATAAAPEASAAQEVASDTEFESSAPLMVNFELFREDNKKAKLLTSISVSAGSAEITPVNVTRSKTYVASIEMLDDGIRVLTPATYEEGVKVSVDRRSMDGPVLNFHFDSASDVTHATRPGQTGVVEGQGFSVSWPVTKARQEHTFSAHGKSYRAVISTK